MCAARRSAELGRRGIGCIDRVTFCWIVIAVSSSISLISAGHGIRRSRIFQRRGQSPQPPPLGQTTMISLIFCPGYSIWAA
jgi:hypothetical protein